MAFGERRITGHETWVDTLTAAGIDVPDGLANAVAVERAAQAHRTTDPIAELRARAASGDLDPDTVGEELRNAAIESAGHDGLGKMLSAIDRPLSDAAGRSLKQNLERIAADAVDAFNAAAAAFVKAVDPFYADDDEVAILRRDLDDEAAALPDHVDRLDALFNVLDRCARHPEHPAPHDPAAALVVSGITTSKQLDQADELLTAATDAPGGRWHELMAAGFTLHANTPAEVNAIHAAVQADEQRRHATSPDVLAEQGAEKVRRATRVRPFDRLERRAAKA